MNSCVTVSLNGSVHIINLNQTEAYIHIYLIVPKSGKFGISSSLSQCSFFYWQAKKSETTCSKCLVQFAISMFCLQLKKSDLQNTKRNETKPKKKNLSTFLETKASK